MTSSLVGSEMCIRDRALTKGSDSCSPPQGQAAAVLGRNGPITTQSVSYTHLTLPTMCSV
eukprot:9337608-Prorocentrum_lima.AAC.1